MIKSSLRFHYNGQNSDDLGVLNVNVDTNGMLQEPFIANRNLNKTRLKYRDKAYFQNIQEEGKTFELQIAFSDDVRMNNSKQREVIRWLSAKDSYKELWFEEDCEDTLDGEDYDLNRPKRIYMATMVGASNLNHFGLQQGYCSVVFETQSPYCESLEKGGYDYHVGEAELNEDESRGSKIYFFNHSDFFIKPQIKIQVGRVNGTDVFNQGIRITGEAIDDLTLGGNFEPNNNFRRTYDVSQTDFSKFLPFEFSEGKKATGFFQLMNTAFYGEKFLLGDYTYEFDLGYGKPYNKLETSNILVPVWAKKAHNTLVFKEDSFVDDGSTVTIGEQNFEYDFNNLVTPTSVKVDISSYVSRAKGNLHLNSNLMPNQSMRVGDVNYTCVCGTNELIVKLTDHLLTDSSEVNYFVNTDRTTLVTDNVNISTKKSKDIDECLLRNITKNPSDLGIRKMKYLNKDFVMTLWDGESDEDYQQQVDGVDVNGRLVITFDTAVNQDTINNDTIECRTSEGNQIRLSFDISTDKKVIGATPITPYDYNTDYFLYVSRGVKDIAGNSFSQVRKIKFHTKEAGAVATVDNYQNVSAVKVFDIYSSKRIDDSTVTDSNVYVVRSGYSTHESVNLNITDSGKTISVSPRTRYEYGEDYNLYITMGVKDIEGNSILSATKTISFSVQSTLNETVIIDDSFIPMTNAFINKPMKVVFNKRLSTEYVRSGSTVVLQDESGNNIPVYANIDYDTPNIILVTPVNNLNYNSIYYLYVSSAVTYSDGSNIESPKKYKVITMTQEYAENYNAPITNVQTSISETGNLNLIHKDYSLVNTDKVITYDFDKTLDVTTVNNDNVYILDSKGNKFTDFTAQVGLAGEGIKVIPNTVWKPDETYSIYITNRVKTTDKPRVFSADVPPDANGNLGDYANAVNIFRPLGFDIIKTNNPSNPLEVQGNELIDSHGNIVKFKSTDIIIGENAGLSPSDFNSDGTVKNGVTIISVPRSITTYGAKRICEANRVLTKGKMQEHADSIKNQAWLTQQLYNEDTRIVTFTTKSINERISIDLDNSILLDDGALLITEVPKKIVGQCAGDTINLYENRQDKMDFEVDRNMLIPNTVPAGAKAYAGRAGDGATNPNKDDYLNAVDILRPLGYDVVDTTNMTYSDKSKIVFHEGDLIIGGELAGSISNDFDANGNLKTTPPQADNPTDTRLERISGIPRGISTYPARRLQSSGDDQGRVGTKKAMEDWAKLIAQASSGSSLGGGYSSNLALNGITVKYKVPKDASVYATGADYYNGLKYLGDMGYKFINVGTMSLAEKMAIAFKEGDLVLGGIQASDTITAGSTATTVTGIPAINIGKAYRIGGQDRYETEKLIKDYATSLKIMGVLVGDIIKLKVTIDNPSNDIINRTPSSNGDEGSQSSTNSGIDKATRIEYHRVKSVQQLARNRVFIEFEEDIRTLNYIKEILITDLYKMYEVRTAEDYLFTAPYQIKIGNDKLKTMLNIVKAINNTGVTGVEYSQYTFKHPKVLAQISSSDEVELNAIEYGSKGNIPVSLIDKIDPRNRFLTSSLEGGRDCTQDNAIRALAKTILEQNDKDERYNKDQYDVSYNSTSLTVTHKMCGKKYNDIICLANITQQEQTPYLITNTGIGVDNGNLVNLNDLLTREKQVAKWDNFTFIGGEDPTIEECIMSLKNKILSNQGTEVMVDYMKNSDGTDDKTGLNIEYVEIGEKGNIPMNTTCVNGKLSGKKLKGGIDGLQVSETIVIDSENQTIVSSTGKDRYKNFNGNWLSIPLDGVMLRVKKGNFVITFAYKEKYYI